MLGFLLLAAAAIALQAPANPPDLVVSKISFQKVESGQDSDGHTYWIFNAIVSIKNQGSGKAGPFHVLLERNNGSGGAFQVACQTCTMAVSGLAAGQELTLEPRQFNNANNAPSTFRATVDSDHAVVEGSESNNSKTETFFPLTISDKGTAPQLALPDLTVTTFDFLNITTSSARGKTYVHFDLVATVKNLGPGKAPESTLFFERALSPKGSYDPTVAVFTVPPLAAGAQSVQTKTGAVYEVGSELKFYRADIDPYNKIKETNEDNNKLPKTVPGY
jgi:subtilase family serine protease